MGVVVTAAFWTGEVISTYYAILTWSFKKAGMSDEEAMAAATAVTAFNLGSTSGAMMYSGSLSAGAMRVLPPLRFVARNASRFGWMGIRFSGQIAMGAARGAAYAAAEAMSVGHGFTIKEVTRKPLSQRIKTQALKGGRLARTGVVYTAAIASGAILGAAGGMGISKAIWGDSGYWTARDFYLGNVSANEYFSTVSQLPALIGEEYL